MKKRTSDKEHSGIDFKLMLKDGFFIVSGILMAAFGLNGFLLPNSFIDGGAMGISLLITEISPLPLYLLVVLVNIPFVALGFKVIGRAFAIKTIIAILGLALVLATVSFPEITQDKLLVAVFGGFFLGAGIGLSIRGGSVLDGTEVLAIFLSRKLGTTIGDIIIGINVLIFLAAAYLLSVETALYSLLTYLAASKTLDFVVEGIEEYIGVTIISDKSAEIHSMIIEKLGHGLTIYTARGGYGKKGNHNEYDVIYTVITRLEIRKLNIEISKIDSKAFVVMNRVNDTRGGMIKKRSLKE
ncbi:YitT family protein [Flavobacteriaceae bacterium 3-367]|uniref:YitT family protein n=1 Tax=Eudoraea algarum TaxID=3417568 RepID=UPI003288E0B3